MALSDYDVAIVGAGFVGASLAIALSRCGLNVVVIDSRTPLVEVGSEDVRGIALSPSSQGVFSELDLWPQLRERAMPIREIRVTEQGSIPSVQLSANEFGLDALAHVVPADHLLRTIENQLLNEAKVIWRTNIEAYHHAGTHVQLNLREPDGGIEQISARLLVGADGVNSKVRELANIASTVRAYNQQAIVATAKIDGLKPDLAIERFTRSGPVAVLPSSPGRHVLVRCCRLESTEQLMAMSDNEFIADVTERLARPIGNISELGQRRAHPLILSRAEQLVAERVALIGAAAVTVHPNAAQGLNLGIRDVAELCQTLAGGTGPDFGSHEQLERFAAKRKRDHRRVVRFTDALARGFGNDFPGLQAVRSLGLLAGKLSRELRREIIYQGVGQGRVQSLPFIHRQSTGPA